VHLSRLAVELARAELADPPDARRVARLAWVMFAELVVTAHAALAARRHLAAVIAGGPAAAETPRYVTALAAELAAASTASPADPDRVAAAAWRILSTLGEATVARAAYLGTLARQFPAVTETGTIITWYGMPISWVPDSPGATTHVRRLAAVPRGAR
jgi:hypothetical protein